jgi:hypothetical protein
LARTLLISLFLLFLASPVLAHQCDLQMTATCTASGDCTATTTNVGSTACHGLYYIGWVSTDEHSGGMLTGTHNSLGLDDCIDSSDYPPGTFAQPFSICLGGASLAPHSSFTSAVQIHGATQNVPLIAMTYVLDEESGEALASVFAYANADVPSCKPRISAPPVAQSNADYAVVWSSVADQSARFIVEESTSPDFTTDLVVSPQINGTSRTFRHQVTEARTYYYRVRPVQCAGGTSEYSEVATTVVQPPPPTVRDSGDAAVPLGSTTPVQFQVFIPGSGSATTTLDDATFTATTDKPYLSVSPSSGTLPPQGTTVTVTANPSGLQPGANTGTLQVTSAGKTSSVPLSISLVTPVQPGTKTVPPPNALIIPVVTHVQGGAGPFLSDVRLTNASETVVKYQITMTPTETDATKFSKVTDIEVEPQQTIALNDIVKNFFGYGATNAPGDIGFGSLEIRAINSSTAQTYASSRTYASTSAGTFGQFIAAVPFDRFITQRTSGLPIPGVPEASTVVSLQQIAQSAKFRTNVGLVEGAGEAANGRVRVYDIEGVMLAEVPFSLQPGEHKQMNAYLRTQAGITTLEDGRLEVIIDSDTGAVSAYASVLDNITTDPLAVMPVDVSKVQSKRYVLPGIAELGGENNFHSDIRIFNGGPSDVTANFTFYPFENKAPVSVSPRTIRQGQVLAIDNVLPTMFNQSATGGSIVVTTSNDSSLVATARTYTNVAGGGTYGQFIPGVTPGEGVGLGDEALQVLQLEQSDRFRSNLGIAELTGNPVDVRLSIHFPDTKVTAFTDVHLNANEFVQFNQIIRAFFTSPGEQTYNARITVEVVGGTGRVTAYGSVIDNKSKDPTYVPAQ